MKRADLFAKTTSTLTVGLTGSAVKDAFVNIGLVSVKGCKLTETPISPTDPFALDFNRNTVDDLWLLVNWGKAD